MNAVAIWILIITSSGAYHPVVVDRFLSEAECMATASDLEKKSSLKRGMYSLYGICVSAKPAHS